MMSNLLAYQLVTPKRGFPLKACGNDYQKFRSHSVFSIVRSINILATNLCENGDQKKRLDL